MFYLNLYSDIELKDIIMKNLDRSFVLDISKIIKEEELEELHYFIDKMDNDNVYFMFSDMAVLSYLKNKTNKLFYSAYTYITNRFDIEYYKSLGIKVFLSHEISLKDTLDCIKYDNVILQTYGYYPIYYSFRLSLSISFLVFF